MKPTFAKKPIVARPNLLSVARALVLLSICSCGSRESPTPSPDEADDQQVGRCESFESGDRAEVEVEIGQGEKDAFVPYGHDELVPLVWGGQGGLMLSSALRVTGTTVADDEEVLIQVLDTYTATTTKSFSSCRTLDPHEGAGFVDQLLHFVGFPGDNPDGTTMTTTVSVQGNGFSGTGSIQIRLGTPGI